jgi:uroporphyrinogen III methyltransferase / synthase
VSGRVYLVGAGPGDPGLLTRRAERLLATADVVVHDALVGPRLLDAVRPDAEVVALARGDDGAERPSQAEIEALLVAHARAGRLVVRLKNGDPFLFGRGGEEAAVLAAAGIPFEIVPGVSSAIAAPAYAGIPLTHRDHASLVTIATGHQADDAGAAPGLPWDALVRQGGTLVFLMAARRLAAILGALRAHGLGPDTPAAVIERGTTGRQRTFTGTATTLARDAEAAGLRAPAVLVVGSVVGLRQRMRWFESRPLFGRRVVVTRARAQAGPLADLLEAQGAEVVLFPTIVIAPAPDPAAVERAVAAAATYDWIVFTSANGVRTFFERFAAQGRDVRELAPVRLAAIGPETAARLGDHLLRPAVLPEEYRAEGMLAALAREELGGRRVLLPRAAGARAILPDTLRARGAIVDEVAVYRAVPPSDAETESLRAALDADGVDALTFTSSSTVRNFALLAGGDLAARFRRPRRPLVACIGPVTAETARELGLPVDVVPDAYTIPALTAALARHFCNGPADGLCEEGR